MCSNRRLSCSGGLAVGGGDAESVEEPGKACLMSSSYVEVKGLIDCRVSMR